MPSFLSAAGSAALSSQQSQSSTFSPSTFTNINSPFPNPPSVSINALVAGTPLSCLYPGDLQSSNYWLTFNIYEYLRISWNQVGSKQMLGSVSLPLPEQLVDSATVAYEQVPVAAGGAGIMDFGNITQQGFKDAGAAVGGGLAATGMQTLNTLGATGAGAGLPGAGGALSAALGVAVNDYTTILLKGPTYKVREFSWKFSPRNAQETDALIQILAVFKNAQAPAYYTNASYAFFGWPNIFQLIFDSKANYDMGLRLYDFQPAVLNDLVVDYTPAGAPSFYGATAAPALYRVSMRFTEIQYWVRNQFRGLSGLQNPSQSFNQFWDPNYTNVPGVGLSLSGDFGSGSAFTGVGGAGTGTGSIGTGGVGAAAGGGGF